MVTDVIVKYPASLLIIYDILTHYIIYSAIVLIVIFNMADEELNLVKNVLFNLFQYLGRHFKITGQVLAALYGDKLIDQPNHDQISHLIQAQKHPEAFQKWYDFANAFYDANQLQKFCGCLRKLAMPTLVHVAEKVEKKMNEVGIPPQGGKPKGERPQLYEIKLIRKISHSVSIKYRNLSFLAITIGEKRRHEDIRADTDGKRFHRELLLLFIFIHVHTC